MDTAPDAALRLKAERQHGVVARAQARKLGFHRNALARRLASPAWELVSPRVLRLVGAPVTFHQRCMAAVLDAGAGAACSHQTAAALWGLPGFRTDTIEVSRRRGGTRRPCALAVVHEPVVWPAHQIATSCGVPVTTVARTVVDLAGSIHPARAERALDSALARRLTTVAALDAAAAELAARGRPGTALLTRLLGARRQAYVAPESALEARLLRLLGSAGLSLPQGQVDVGGESLVGRADFVYRAQRLLVEVDSSVHHSTLVDKAADARRDLALVEAGFRVVRITEEQVWYRPKEVVERVRAALAA